jgi:hypothetical protein
MNYIKTTGTKFTMYMHTVFCNEFEMVIRIEILQKAKTSGLSEQKALVFLKLYHILK